MLPYVDVKCESTDTKTQNKLFIDIPDRCGKSGSNLQKRDDAHCLFI